MAVRIDIRKLPLWILLAVAAVIVLISPFVLYSYVFQTRLRDNQEKWARLAADEYEIVVTSNTLSDCTAGWNTILVRDGEIVEARNSEQSDCPRERFGQLTVEALFDRIWDECVRNRPLGTPFPVCNVVYDEELGFPRRLDTYTRDEQGVFLPSVGVERVTLNPLEP